MRLLLNNKGHFEIKKRDVFCVLSLPVWVGPYLIYKGAKKLVKKAKKQWRK